MADSKVSALVNASALAGTEEFHVTQGGADRAASVAQVATFVAKAPVHVSGRWYVPEGIVGINTAAGAQGADTMRMFAFLIRKATTITGLTLRCVTAAAGGNVQMAAYAADAATGAPTGAPLYSSPGLSTAASGAVSQTGISVTLQPGLYWLASNTDTTATTATFMSNSGAAGQAGLIGITQASGSFSATGQTKAQTYGTWPTLTGSYTTDVLVENTSAAQIPVINYLI